MLLFSELYNMNLYHMNKLNSFLLVFFVIVSANSHFQLFDQYQQFEKYVSEYGKDYMSFSQKLFRFKTYLNNLKDIEYLNKIEQGTAVYGETPFTDLTKEQMKTFLGVKIPENFEPNYIANFTNDPNYKPKSTTPDVWNWVQQGAVTEIKDQGTCGSCWSFSTAGNVQGLYYLKHKELMNFSQQQLIDCDITNFGCSGGWPYAAIDWLSKHGGLQTSQDYPLRKNYTGPCEFNSSQTQAKAQIKGYMNISRDQDVIKDALYEMGPLSILLDFTGLFHYKSGIASPKYCYTWPDHALVLVGYGVKDEDYWYIKNSWGPKWGINGYFMLKKGKNKCGVAYWATTALLE